MKLKIILIISLLLLFMNTASADWVSDPSIVTGLGNVGELLAPEVYYDSGVWKMITGEYNHTYGFEWNGTSWVSNSTLVTGLPATHINYRPTIFNDSGTWKLIIGTASDNFLGYDWNGTSWVSNSTLVTGLPSATYIQAAPEVYDDSGTWKLIVGESNGNFYGYDWNGTSWVSNSSIVSGLTDVGTWSTPEVYDDSGTWKLIAGNESGYFNGFQWNGTSWVSDSSMVTGLTDIGAHSTPAVFNDSGTWKLISGNYTPGYFTGFYLNTAPTTSALKIESKSSPAEISTNITTPYFTWTYSDVNSDTQTHWQIYVGTSSGASDKWNSGKMSGTDTSDIYAGSTLNGSTIYYIQIKTNDSHEWSAWETGTFIILTPAPINIANTTGTDWINWTFAAGSGDIDTDSFNISIGGSWTNGSSNFYHNATSLSGHTDYTIDIYAYNSTYGLSSSSLSDTATTLNNAPTVTDVSATYEIYEGSTFTLDANYTDPDSDTCTFSDNSTNWSINSATGEVSWLTDSSDVGVHSYRITINDGYSGTDYVDFTVTVIAVQNTAIESIDTSFTSALSGSDFTDNTISLSFILNNTGSAAAIVTAKFTTVYDGTYGLTNSTKVIGGSNFQIGNSSYNTLTDAGTPVTLTTGVPADSQVNYGVRIKIPTGQDALNYVGTVELTFS